MRSLFLVVSFGLLWGCSEVPPPKGDAPAEDLCALTSLAWADSFSAPCGASDAAVCYDALTVSVEPMAADFTALTLDLAFCLEGEVTAADYGVTMALSEAAASGLLDMAVGHGHLTADDGFAPCYGLTVGLDGELAEALRFSEGSYWWKDGTKPRGVGADDTGGGDAERRASGTFTEEAEYLNLWIPDALASALALPAAPLLTSASLDHWTDPSCPTDSAE